MARRMIALAVLGLLPACAAPARAGLYSSAEPPGHTLSPDYRQFRETLINLWDVAKLADDTYFNDLKKLVADKSSDAGKGTDETYRSLKPLTRRYFLIKLQLGQGTPANLTGGERTDLGAALIRVGKADEAVNILKPRGVQDQRDFLLLSNLATAHYLAGQEQLAVTAVSTALDVWPKDWAKLDRDRRVVLALQFGWDPGQFAWYRKAETSYKKLLLRRLGQPPDKLDNLFGVRFVGEGGKYEPGTIAAAERKKLPEDAVQTVEQLLVWLPTDVRLQWLLGELYNARGDTKTALEIFNNLVGYNGKVSSLRQFQELREHRRILQAHLAAAPAQGGGGSFPKGNQSAAPPPDGAERKAEGGSAGGWSPSPWQTLGVGFLAGLLVALLGMWQVREIVRRRQFEPRS